jgi:tRNA modification GTPase
MHDFRTSIACLTPAGVGAIATLAVRGPRAWSIASSLFRPALPVQPIPGKFYLGQLGEEANACDEVLLAVKPDGLELHCHGGVVVVRFLQAVFAGRGVAACTWQDQQHGDGISPLRRLAWEQLVHAPTVRTAAILLDQLHGAFDNTLADILGSHQNDNHASAVRLLGRLVQTQHLGRHLVEPFRVVIAGAPNVGKSSLVNALAGYTRSLVSAIPGTTRDVVTTRIALEGWPVELIDTAGLHASEDVLERAGMARAQTVLERADLRLWVLDGSASPLFPPADIPFHGFLINKTDLPAAWEGEVTQSREYVSAKTGQGVTNVCQWIARLLRFEKALASGEGVAFTPELCTQVLLADEAMRGGDWRSATRIVRDIVAGRVASC